MTRAELEAMLSAILGLRVRPIEFETIMMGVDAYVAAETKRIEERRLHLADVPANGPGE
jgi:hypothetical protein